MVCLGFEPGVAGWKAQTNPLSYGGTPNNPQLKPNSNASIFTQDKIFSPIQLYYCKLRL